MMVVGDNLGEKEEKIEEAAWEASAPLLYLSMMIILEQAFIFLTKRPDHHVKS